MKDRCSSYEKAVREALHKNLDAYNKMIIVLAPAMIWFTFSLVKTHLLIVSCWLKVSWWLVYLGLCFEIIAFYCAIQTDKDTLEGKTRGRMCLESLANTLNILALIGFILGSFIVMLLLSVTIKAGF